MKLSNDLIEHQRVEKLPNESTIDENYVTTVGVQTFSLI